MANHNQMVPYRFPTLRGPALADFVLQAAAARNRFMADPIRRRQLLAASHINNLFSDDCSRMVRIVYMNLWQLLNSEDEMPQDLVGRIYAAINVFERALNISPMPRDLTKLEPWCVRVVLTMRQALVAAQIERTEHEMLAAKPNGVFNALEFEGYPIALHFSAIQFLNLYELRVYSPMRSLSLTTWRQCGFPGREMLHNGIDISSVQLQGQFVKTLIPYWRGTLVVVEKPFASVLLPSRHHTHCYQCFKRLSSAIYCKCEMVLFCSASCRALAEPYHHFECPVMPEVGRMAFTDFMSNAIEAKVLAQLALRMVSQFSLEQNRTLFCSELPASMVALNWTQLDADDPRLRYEHWVPEEPEASDWNHIDNNYFMGDLKIARRVHTMSTNVPRHKSSDYLRFLTIALSLKELLRRANYFDCKKSFKNDEIIILDLLMRSLLQVSNNHHYITETTRGEVTHHNHLAIGIYATGSLFNINTTHNVTRSFVGKFLEYRTACEILPRQPLSDNIINFELQYSAGAMSDTTPPPYTDRIRCAHCAMDGHPTLGPYLGPIANICVRRCTTLGCTEMVMSNRCATRRLCTRCVTRFRMNDRHLPMFVRLFVEAMNLLNYGCVGRAQEALYMLMEMLSKESHPPHTLFQMAHSSYYACCAKTRRN